MKKKLLITLGCSFTEGVGAYDLSETYVVKDSELTPENIHTFMNAYRKNTGRFHQYGWPVKLQKKLNYDVLINLGSGGSSNSHQAKKFYEYFYKSDVTEHYDVLVIWMMTFSHRVSFYSGGSIKSCIPKFKSKIKNPGCDELGDAYVNFVRDIEHDSLLETIFYLQTVEAFCKTQNFKFLYLTLENQFTDIIDKLHPTDNFLHRYAIKSQGWKAKYLDTIHEFSDMERGIMQTDLISSQIEKFKSPVCLHPNEHGYEFASERLYHIINEFYPTYINNNQLVSDYKNLYIGDKSQLAYHVSRQEMEQYLW